MQVLDIVATVNHIIGVVLFSDCQLLAADGNEDNEVNVLDAVLILDIILMI